jgi:hypothetical protein
VTRAAAAVLALAMALVPAVLVGAAAAEHRVDSRYVVIGYARDARGRALGGRVVRVVREKTAFTYLAETDGEGLYVVVVRLGDESVGERLAVEVEGHHLLVTARFDPANRVDERGTRVDLDGGRLVERPAAFRSTLARFLGNAR